MHRDFPDSSSPPAPALGTGDARDDGTTGAHGGRLKPPAGPNKIPRHHAGAGRPGSSSDSPVPASGGASIPDEAGVLEPSDDEVEDVAGTSSSGLPTTDADADATLGENPAQMALQALGALQNLGLRMLHEAREARFGGDSAAGVTDESGPSVALSLERAESALAIFRFEEALRTRRHQPARSAPRWRRNPDGSVSMGRGPSYRCLSCRESTWELVECAWCGAALCNDCVYLAEDNRTSCTRCRSERRAQVEVWTALQTSTSWRCDRRWW